METEQHNIEIHENREVWDKKPTLRLCYADFYNLIKDNLSEVPDKPTLELGSGMGNIKSFIPNCITSDLFGNPWLDRQENAYRLSFDDGALSNLVLFDVFHHLRYPGTALGEFHRVLAPGGRVVMLEPGFGLLGRFVYERFHHEPCGFGEEIVWRAPEGFDPATDSYYAAQGNAWRVVRQFDELPISEEWRLTVNKPLSALAYVASGGFRGPALYPGILHPLMSGMDRLLSVFPSVFATRLLVVLEKKDSISPQV